MAPSAKERARRALWAVTRNLRGHMREAFAAHGLTVPQGMVLHMIAEGRATSPGQVADLLCVTPGNVTGVLQRLEERGVLARSPDPEDRRAVRLALTPAGKRLMADLEEVAAEALDAGFSRLKPAELSQLVGLLERVADLEPAPPAASRARMAPRRKGVAKRLG